MQQSGFVKQAMLLWVGGRTSTLKRLSTGDWVCDLIGSVACAQNMTNFAQFDKSSCKREKECFLLSICTKLEHRRQLRNAETEQNWECRWNWTSRYFPLFLNFLLCSVELVTFGLLCFIVNKLIREKLMDDLFIAPLKVCTSDRQKERRGWKRRWAGDELHLIWLVSIYRAWSRMAGIDHHWGEESLINVCKCKDEKRAVDRHE